MNEEQLTKIIQTVLKENRRVRDAYWYYDEYQDGYNSGWDDALEEIQDELLLAIRSTFVE